MGKPHRILIIDDSKAIVEALKSFFELKYETLTAHNGFDGLQTFEQCVFLTKPATDSDRKRPLIPIDSGHPFRRKAATL